MSLSIQGAAGSVRGLNSPRSMVRTSRTLVMRRLAWTVLCVPCLALATPSGAEQRCLGGEASACVQAADSLLPADGGTADVPGAAALLEKACDGGVARACARAGALRMLGQGIPKDEAKALGLLERACVGADPLGCRGLGLAYLRGAGGSPDTSRALAPLQKACNGGDAPGCFLLGVVYSYAPAANRDERKAAELFEKACRGGEPNACAVLGSAYERGDGVPRDQVRAVKLFRQACDAGAREGCGSLARALYFGWGVRQDRETAGKFYEKAYCLSREEAPPVPADTPQGAWENLRANYARCEYSAFMLATTARSHDELLCQMSFFVGIGLDPDGGPTLGPDELKELENLLRHHGLSLWDLGDPGALSRVKSKPVLYAAVQRFFRRHGLGPTVPAYLLSPLENLQVQGSRATAKIGDFGTMSFEKTGEVWLVDHPRSCMEELESRQKKS